MKSLADQTPAEIDGQLAEIMIRRASIEAQIVQHDMKVDALYRRLDSFPDRVRLNGDYARKIIADADAAISGLRAQSAQLHDQAAPLYVEYDRRGGWTRAYIVKNASGHVHSSTRCQTCFTTTEFAWITDLSGHAESEIVEQAGEKACTVCYPSAPVDVLKRKCRIEDPDRRAARIKREQDKADRAAKKAAKAITTPDGEELTVYDWTIPARTVRRTDGTVVTRPPFEKRETLKTLSAARQWLTDAYCTWRRTPRDEDVQAVTDAIAAKEGKTTEQVTAEARKRAANRK